MKISYNWLKDYLNIDLPKDELSAILTEIGLEVAKVEEYESVKGGLQGLVIGEVLTCEKHPNADKLSVTTVDVGGKILPIVCGAPNVAKGQKVVVATVGTVLYDGDDEFKIKKSKIRGEVSEGMICAEDEIGLGNNHDGIMVLPENVQTGTPAAEYFDVYKDIVYEIDLTPNRPDAISHFGVARDLYAYLKLNTDLDIELKLPDVSKFSVDNTNFKIDVEVRNQEACPRYTGLTISNIQVKESPEWMQNRLKAIGLKPINNIVDITNYVLHEIGHPLHAFDANKVEGNKILVSTVEPGTKFKTLDEQEINLHENDLMICDAKLTPLCIGGVMGGLESGIIDETKNIFLESAFFNPVWVRKTAKRHGISSDSSYRFERGVDPNNCLWTLKRTASLIKELAGGQISSDIIDVYPEKIENFKVELEYKQLDKIIGFELDRNTVKNILQLLEIQIVTETEKGLQLEVPTYRFEVRREADIIEEIIKIYGYNKIPMPESLTTTILVQDRGIAEKMRETIAHLLTARGFYEIMSFSLLNSEIYKKISDFDINKAISLENPLSKDLEIMRKSLIFGALTAVRQNVNNQNLDVKFFEFGSAYFKTQKPNFEEKYIQKYRLSLTVSGLTNKVSWKTGEIPSDFYTLKGYAEAVLKAIGFNRKDLKIKQLNNDIYKYAIEYYYNNKPVMIIGAVSRKMLKIYDISQEVFFAEIEWGDLLENIPQKQQFKDIVRFNKVKRDLALLLDKNIPYEQIEKVAYDTDKKILKEVNIFDVYEGQNIPEGKKSYAITFILQDENKTLTDKVIDKLMKKLIYNYENKIGAIIRK